MATHSYNIIQEINALREMYLSDDNFGASLACDLAVDHTDGLSKVVHEPASYYESLISRLAGIETHLRETDAEGSETIGFIVSEIVKPMYHRYLNN